MTVRFAPGDFETRSPLELPDVGVARYAEHPDTDVWCLAYSPTDDPNDIRLWTRNDALPPLDLFEALDAGAYFRAWNAAFEETIWREIMVKRYGWPALAPNRFVCAMAMAAAAALPLSLDKAAIALRLTEQKDMVGYKHMLMMSRPRKFKKKEVRPAGPGPFWCDHDPANLPRLGSYCKQDVRTEMAAWRATPPSMDSRERAIWLLDQRINRRGITLDLPLIRSAQRLINIVKPQLDARVAELTGGLAVTQVEKIKDWLSTQGVETASLDKESLGEMLTLDISDDVRTVLIARQEGAKSSTSKYATMLGAACADGRVRGTMQYYGATTGRWAGRGIQPHNMPLPTRKITTAILDDIREGNLAWIEGLHGPVLPLLADALRTCFIAAPGKRLAVADYKTIEARVVAWLACEDDLLEKFRQDAPLYEEFAARIHDVLLEELLQYKRDHGSHHPWRQDGKVGILGCGFGMGPDRMHEQYGIPMDLCVKIVKLYRSTYTNIVALWTNMNQTANDSVLLGGRIDVPDTAGRLAFESKGGYLLLHLPSGRALWYHAPIVRTYTVRRTKEVIDLITGETKVVDASFEATGVELSALHPKTKQWHRTMMYGGIWVENATQAVARDIIADGMLRAENTGEVPMILSVHDEAVAEVEPTYPLRDYLALLTTVPPWAAGCPIDAEGYIEERYRK